MLGTFSFEPYFKSYRCFTVGSLEFLEIAKQPFLPPPACLLALFLPAAAVQVAGAVESLPGHVLRRAGAHASRCSSSTALGCALVPPLQCHAAQSRPRGRHLAAAVASSLQRRPPSPSARTSLTKTPEIHSSHSFAFSSLPQHAGELTSLSTRLPRAAPLTPAPPTAPPHPRTPS